jgi:RHS repeat-associated protein
VTTNYVLDLNAGLTQVLSDGTSQYLYGLGRVGEYVGGQWAYYATDALGSVRQIVDANGQVVFYQSYEPYGKVLVSSGTAESNYGYAGEWTDAYIKLIYLRSRYYAPTTGRFLTKDVWQGDYTRPLSLNAWNYVAGNPVNYIDPSGMIYNRSAAVSYARQHDLGAPPITSYTEDGQTYYLYPYVQDCTHFVSLALWEGGLRDTRKDPRLSDDGTYLEDGTWRDIPGLSWWSKEAIRVIGPGSDEALHFGYAINEASTTWSVAGKLREFLINGLSDGMAREVVNFTNPPRFYGNGIGWTGNKLEEWDQTLIDNSYQILPGDIVFYSNGNPSDGAEWDHAAIITGWDYQSFHRGTNPFPVDISQYLDCGFLTIKPHVVERNGSINYGDGTRAIDNTIIPYYQISIIHIYAGFN